MAVRTNRPMWQEQLSDIMEALARAAVAEICGVMEDRYALLNMEITRKDKENQDLKTKLHLIESIVARGSGNDSWKKAGAIVEEPGGGPAVGEGRTVFQYPETEPHERGREGGHTADAPGGNGAADDVVLREELPDVVLIKDEDSDCDEDMKAAADGAVAPIGRGMKRSWSRDPKLKTSPDSLTVKKTPKVTAHTLTHTQNAHTLAHTQTPHILTQIANTLTHTENAHTLTQTAHRLHTQNAHTLAQTANTLALAQNAHTLTQSNTQTPHTLTHTQTSNTLAHTLTQTAHTLTHTPYAHTLTHTQKNTQTQNALTDTQTAHTLTHTPDAHTLSHTQKNTQTNTLSHTQNNPIYTLDSPRSDPGCSENMDAFSDSDDVQEMPCFAPNPNTTNTRQTASYLNNNNNNSAASMESQSPSNRAEINLNLTWTKQATDKNHMTSTSFSQNNMDAVEIDSENDAFGLKLVSVSGSTTSTDFSHLSENSSNSAFEYEENTMDIMSYSGLYREQVGRPQSNTNTNRMKRFVCSICSRTYATQQNLEVHMRIHTGEKPFSCSQCGKKFNQSAHLKTHLSVHTGERPYACTMCSRSFIVRYSLKLHMNKCHNNNV